MHSTTGTTSASSAENPASTRPLRILYAVQGTGNGHVARARAVIPRLQAYPDVHLTVWLSGTESEVPLPVVPERHLPGLTLQYANGGLRYLRTLVTNRWSRFVRDVLTVPVDAFDLVVNDFEPVTAWAVRLRGGRLLEVSHQAGVRHPAAPRPRVRRPLMEALLRWYAPAPEAIGLHFMRYDEAVLPPVIRDEIRSLPTAPDGSLLVYLPAYAPEALSAAFAAAPVPVRAFAKGAFAPFTHGAVTVEPIAYDRFLEAFASASSVLCSAGFELSAEAMYHGKRLGLIPIRGQYEQACNAAAAAQLGVVTAPSLQDFLPCLAGWLSSPMPARREFGDVAAVLAERIVHAARHAVADGAAAGHATPCRARLADRTGVVAAS